LQWDSVVGENYSNKKKIFKAFSTFSSSSYSSLGATTGLSLRFPQQQGCKEKRVPLARVRQLLFCLFSLVDVDGITTRVVRLSERACIYNIKDVWSLLCPQERKILNWPEEMNAVSTKVLLRFSPPVCPFAPSIFSQVTPRHVLYS